MELPTNKRCTICGVVKALDAFYRAAATTDGRQARCKPCHLERAREYRQRMKERNDARPPDLQALKRCPSCAEVKAGSDFYRNRTSKDGLHWVCKACNGSGPYSPTNEQRRRFRRYAITEEEVAALLLVQHGACAICRAPFEGTSFHIDHCHDTGTVRGLLCSNCNSGLGLLADDRERLLTAVRYLEQPPIGSVREA
jgi:hypothetical protein